LGLGAGSELDAKSLRYGRVIIMTDADVDVRSLSSRCICTFSELFSTFISFLVTIVFATAQGAHIRVLLLTFFIVISELLEQGHVYRTAPQGCYWQWSVAEAYAFSDKEVQSWKFLAR
jgi:DNA gyrase/topoisomerase IV subunit B